MHITADRKDDYMSVTKYSAHSYRIEKTIKGKRFSTYLDHKPSKYEVDVIVSGWLGRRVVTKMTFGSAALEYLDLKSNVLSPSTLRGYKKIIESTGQEFLDIKLSDLKSSDVQAEINRLSETYSPKTVSNHYGLITAVVREFAPELKISATKPQRLRQDPYIPTEQDIKALIEYADNTNPQMSIVLKLACMGLRRSEICALTADDIHGNTVTINKAKILDPSGNWIIKPTPKTSESSRKVPISPELARDIKKYGLYSGNPTQISNFTRRAEKELGLNNFSIHKLRHYFCSKCIDMGLDFKTIQTLGGWSSMDTINKIYAHAMNEKEKGVRVAAEISKLF